MKKKLALFTFCLMACSSFGQLTFNVSPGLNLNSAALGYQFNKIEPYVGFQMFSGSFNWEQKGQEFDINGNLVDYTNTVDTRVQLFLPTIGVKYYAVDKESIKGYINANFTKVIATGKHTIDGQVDDDVKEAFDGTSLWGGELGYGMEYFFDEHFSIGGEFGLRMLAGKNETTYNTTIFDPTSGGYIDSKVTNTTKGSFSPTYTRIGLKFYF